MSTKFGVLIQNVSLKCSRPSVEIFNVQNLRWRKAVILKIEKSRYLVMMQMGGNTAKNIW